MLTAKDLAGMGRKTARERRWPLDFDPAQEIWTNARSFAATPSPADPRVCETKSVCEGCFRAGSRTELSERQVRMAPFKWHLPSDLSPCTNPGLPSLPHKNFGPGRNAKRLQAQIQSDRRPSLRDRVGLAALEARDRPEHFAQHFAGLDADQEAV